MKRTVSFTLAMVTALGMAAALPAVLSLPAILPPEARLTAGEYAVTLPARTSHLYTSAKLSSVTSNASMDAFWFTKSVQVAPPSRLTCH